MAKNTGRGSRSAAQSPDAGKFPQAKSRGTAHKPSLWTRIKECWK